MRAFTCPRCRQLVPFEAVRCLACGTGLGFDPEAGEIVDTGGRALCANGLLAGCNWLLAPWEPAGGLCRSCRLTRARPPDADLAAAAPTREAYRAAQAAKRGLVCHFPRPSLPVAP